ncbi:hypothetical protein [Nocardia nepalensis]|uniref:hypothetical protein n=1 Tax=Nocardia nepalensis TaxID=3375448 RepID=UPI003B67E1E4
MQTYRRYRSTIPLGWSFVTCTSPLFPGLLPQATIDEIRAEMRALGPVIPVPYHPLSDRLRVATRVIRYGLERYVKTGAVRAGRLYVLDFQGPGEWQYINVRTHHPRDGADY